MAEVSWPPINGRFCTRATPGLRGVVTLNARRLHLDRRALHEAAIVMRRPVGDYLEGQLHP